MDYLSIGFVSLFFTIITAQSCFDDGRLMNKVLAVEGETYSLSSPGFPHECCGQNASCTWTITYTEYIRITFTDLDLPPLSRLQIRDGAGNLFNDQPSYRGHWYRPVIAGSIRNSEVKVTFYRAEDTEAYYTGFKMLFLNTAEEPSAWRNKPISDRCGQLRNPSLGVEHVVKSVSSSTKENMLDCVWLVKNSHQFSDYPDVSVFIRITNLTMTGSLEFRDNSTSEGDVLLNLTEGSHDLYSLNATVRRWGVKSSTGLYVHLKMPAFSGGNIIVLSSGIYRAGHRELDEVGCKFSQGGQWFLCDDDDDSLAHCLAPSLRCNHYNNCASGRDESLAVCHHFRPTTTSTTTTMRTTTTTRRPTVRPTRYCPSYRKRCPTGECLPSYQRCPGECLTHQKNCGNGKCADRNERCDPCPNGEYHCGLQCYSESDRCDGYSDCDNGADEQGCDTYDDSSGIPWWPFIVVGLALFMLFLCCYYCCKKSSKRESQTVRYETATAGQPAAVSGITPSVPRAGYAPTPARQTTPAATTPSAPPTSVTQVTVATPTAPNEDESTELDPMMAPPPSYSDAISNSMHNIPGGEVPPPAYNVAVAKTNLVTNM